MLPKNLKYGNKIESSQAKSYIANIQPNGALDNYAPNSVCTINIPTGPNLALVCAESYLQMSVTTIGANDGRLDSCGAHGYIQRIRIFHGSNLLEDTDNYGLYAKQMFDLQVSTDAAYGKYSILAGTRNDQVSVNPIAGSPAVAANAATAAINDYNSTGKTLNINSGALVVYNTTYTYCLSLISLLGTLCNSNYFPLFACTSAPLRLEIQFVDNVKKAGAFANATTGFRVDKINYIGSYLQLSDPAMSMIMGSLNGSLSFTTQGIRNYQTSYNLVSAVQTQFNFAIPAKFGSVKSIIVSARNLATQQLYFPYSCNKFGLQSYNFRIGSQSSIPAISPTTDAQFFIELLKSINSISDLNHQPSIDIESYVMNEPAVSTAATIANGSIHSGSFYIGLDLENYAESDKSTIYTGYNTKNDDIFCVMNYLNGTGANVNARFDAFVCFDQEIVFENNTCYVSF